jgi:hypothetical protein
MEARLKALQIKREALSGSALLKDAKHWLLTKHPQANLGQGDLSDTDLAASWLSQWQTHELLNPYNDTSGTIGNLTEAFIDSHIVAVNSPYADRRTFSPAFSIMAEDQFTLGKKLKEHVYRADSPTHNERVALANEIVLLKLYENHFKDEKRNYRSLTQAIESRVQLLAQDLNTPQPLVGKAEQLAREARGIRVA